MSTRKTILSTWPIFAGIIIILLGNGLQTTLIGVRGAILNFDPSILGGILSCYFIGYIAGCIITPRLIKNVGHIRVYAAFASVSSSIVLIYTITGNPGIWVALRILSGFAFASIFIVSESWLNAASTVKNRGKVLSAYMISVFVAQATAQFFLNFGDPASFELFILVSVLISLALVPLSLSKRPTPKYETPNPISIKRLFSIAPLGIIGCFAGGLTSTTFIVIAPVFAYGQGLTDAQIALFMAASIIAGMLFQIPTGWISDKIDRRKVLVFNVTLAAVACFSGALAVAHGGLGPLFFIAAFFASGLMLTIYSLSATHANDRLDESEIINASAALILINGCGSLVGPFAVGLIMKLIGPSAFLLFPGCVCLGVASFALYRMAVSKPVAPEERGEYMALPDKPSHIVAEMAAKEAHTD
ncbi:MAG: MFS transporter [Pseudobdellovibrionaceae bacterium]